MRYDAYRLPGVKWRWVGIGKSPEPDCWPESVVIEGVRVKTIRGKGWGWSRAFYACPLCDREVKSLYTAPLAPVKVACRKHWAVGFCAREDAFVARERASGLRLKYRNESKLREVDAMERAALDKARIVR